MTKPTVVDLFCGCGGFSLGFIQAGYDVLLGLDNEPMALTTYVYNLARKDVKWIGDLPKPRFRNKHWNREDHPPVGDNGTWPRTVRTVICKDIRKLSGFDILNAADVDSIDVVIGSPPCKTFSAMSRHKYGATISDPMDFLPFEFMRLVEELRPKTFLMENVPGIMSKKTESGIPVMKILERWARDIQ